MNLRIRHLTVGLLVLYAVLFVQLNIVQLVRADDYRSNEANTRDIVRQFSEPRGRIITGDGRTIAESIVVATDLERLRSYPDGELYAHVTGYLSLNFGASGLERSLNEELAGATTEIGVKSLADLFVERDRTADVIVTLDHEVQRIAQAALGDRKGAVVAMDPRTGALLALWSWPSFDPNELAAHDLAAVADARQRLLDAPGAPLRSRAHQERYPPGSTFKLVTAAAAIESLHATPTDPIFEVAAEYIAPQTERPITNFGGSACGGDLTELMRVSCNTGFAELGVIVGANRMAVTARAFGFNERPDTDLPDAVASVFPSVEFFEDNVPLLAQSAIGQFEVAATPLQMAMIAAAIANDGVLMRPHVVAEVVDSDGTVVRRTEPEVLNQPVARETADDIETMMEGVVAAGTARTMQIPGVRVAAKTGTAELGTVDGTHAWVVGFAPVGAPRIAVAVFVEGDATTGQQTGGAVAGPIAREVIRSGLEVTATTELPPGAG